MKGETMSELIGIPLSTYKEEPEHIPEGKSPVHTITRFRKRVMDAFDTDRYDMLDDLYRDCHQLPTEVLQQFSIVEIMKIRAASVFMLRSHEINRKFDEVPEYRIFDKIASSMWRWGYGDFRDDWSSLVDAYRGIRNFSFGLPDFEVTLGHTTGNNECGRCEQDRELFLDGVFGFLVHYKGVHIMTIGFTIARDKKLVLTQVQMKKEKGNRFLFKLPTSCVEYALTLLARHFPMFTICLLEGDMSVKKYLGQYRALLENTFENQKRNELRIAVHEHDVQFGKVPTERELESYRWELKHRGKLVEDVAFVKERIAGLEGEIGARIRSTYDRDHGAWRRDLSDMTEINGVRFCRMVRA
jgi:hypothetical protein